MRKIFRKQTGRLILEGLAASLCGYLAWVAADLVQEQMPRLLLAAVTAMRVSGFDSSLASPGGVVRPAEALSPGFFSLYLMSEPLWGSLLLLPGPLLVGRLRGWLGLFFTQLFFCIGFRVVIYGALIGYSALGDSWFPAPFSGSGWLATGARLLLGIAFLGWGLHVAHGTLRRFLDRSGKSRAGRFRSFAGRLLVPFVAAGAALTLLAPPRGMFQAWIPAAAALAFLLATALPAVYRNRKEAAAPVLSVSGALVVGTCFALAVGSILGYGALQGNRRRAENLGEFVSQPSEHGSLNVQKPLLETRKIEEWARDLDGALGAMASRLGLELPNPGMARYLYRSAALKRSMTGSDESFTVVESRNEVHHLVTISGRPDDPRGDALLLMRHCWGKPGSEALASAIARYAVGSFLEDPLEEYGRRIAAEEGLHSLGEIFGFDGRFFSPLVRDALGGLWVAQLVEERGTGQLERVYREPLVAGKEEVFARALGTTWEALEQRWQVLEGRLQRISAAGDEPTVKAPFFQRGMTLTQRGYGTGYGSERAEEQMSRLSAQGVDTVTLVPYGDTRAPEGAGIAISRDSRDDRLIRTLQAAQRAGMRRVLKPQLSIGDGFVGNISFADPARFSAWFENYRRWMLHYARIAALYSADCLVVGTELAGVTRYEASWRSLIRDVRRIYSGPLTYAAHWGSDFEELPFWDALDYIGLNMYYPLAVEGEELRPDAPRLRTLAARFAMMARRYGKRIVFTEVGFPNTAAAAAEPFRKTRQPMDLELQARCVQVVFQAFYREPWLGGMNWWEWPSTGQGGSRYETYILAGNPAAGVIMEWYAQRRQ